MKTILKLVCFANPYNSEDGKINRFGSEFVKEYPIKYLTNTVINNDTFAVRWHSYTNGN